MLHLLNYLRSCFLDRTPFFFQKIHGSDYLFQNINNISRSNQDNRFRSLQHVLKLDSVWYFQLNALQQLPFNILEHMVSFNSHSFNHGCFYSLPFHALTGLYTFMCHFIYITSHIIQTFCSLQINWEMTKHMPLCVSISDSWYALNIYLPISLKYEMAFLVSADQDTATKVYDRHGKWS